MCPVVVSRFPQQTCTCLLEGCCYVPPTCLHNIWCYHADLLAFLFPSCMWGNDTDHSCSGNPLTFCPALTFSCLFCCASGFISEMYWKCPSSMCTVVVLGRQNVKRSKDQSVIPLNCTYICFFHSFWKQESSVSHFLLFCTFYLLHG